MRTIVVLGGTGFVGRHVVARAAAAGHRVVVVTRRRANARTLFLLPTVDIVVGDCADPALLARVLTGADAVVNLVGILNERGRLTFERAHVELARTIVAACRAAGVARFVQMSALGAAIDGPSRYLCSKGAAEAIVMQSGLAWTIFRPSVIFGRDDHFLNMFATLAKVLPVIMLGGADARFQPVWVDDVAACIAQSIDSDATVGQSYNLCGPQVYSLRELVRWTLDTVGTPRPIVPLGAGMASVTARVLEMLPGQLLTRDNLASMQVASTCSGAFPPLFGIVPTRLEAVAPGWLAPASQHGRYDDYRAHGGR